MLFKIYECIPTADGTQLEQNLVKIEHSKKDCMNWLKKNATYKGNFWSSKTRYDVFYKVEVY